MIKVNQRPIHEKNVKRSRVTATLKTIYFTNRTLETVEIVLNKSLEIVCLTWLLTRNICLRVIAELTEKCTSQEEKIHQAGTYPLTVKKIGIGMKSKKVFSIFFRFFLCLINV